tara:strand:+ start:3899 stop:6160 length:2262 start_codon:yes stop_codon:yes gene_type:complete
MLRLVLWNSAETEQFNIDLYEHIPVEVTYQFSDIQNINSSVGNYSQTFRVPATKSNLDFFGAVIMPSVVASSGTLINDNFDIKKKIRAELSDGGVTIIQGFVQVKAIYRQKKEFHELELILFGETVDLAKKVGDKQLSDLDMSSLDHVLNYANVAFSWIGGFSFPYDGTLRYSLMDKGFNWSFNNVEQYPYTSTDGLWVGELTPCIQARWILDKIISEAGYTYTSAFFSNADFDKVMLPAFNGALTPVSNNTTPELELAGGGVITTQGPLTATYQSVEFNVSITGGYDYNGNTNPASNRYNAPYTGLYTITLSFKTLNQPPPQTPVCDFRRNGTSIYYFEGQFTHTFSVILEAGDYLEMFAKKAGGLSQTILKGSSVGNNDTTWWRIDSISDPLTGQTVDMALNMPTCKQIDFLSTLQKMYNLVIIPDKVTPNKLLIEPFQDFIATGENVDWTTKIDFTKDVEIKPTTDLQRKKYNWQNSAGGDFVNEAVTRSLDRVYGRFQVTDTDNDFATGENKITTSFASYILSYIPGSTIPIHRLIDDSGEAIEDPLPRFCNWVGFNSTDIATIFIKNDSGTTINIGFPYVSNYSVAEPSVTDQDLNFGSETAFIAIEAHPANTLYWKYWAQYVTELYSSDSRIMSLFVNLSNVDIHNFKFNDKVYIENEYWRILSIENYDATTTVPTKVTLIKVLSDLPLCADIPTGFDDRFNAILFNNVPAPYDYGTQECCEQYGYVWIGGLGGKCYSTSIQSTPAV